MSTTYLLQALPPQQYDFRNWDFFQSEALRYHKAAHPNEDLVIERIATFRSLMSPDVIEYLGPLVNLNSRFETAEGWNEWLSSATDILRERDLTIKDPTTPESWMEQFKSNKANERQFWTGLDTLSSKGSISNEEQRLIFWEAHSWEKQALLKNKSPYFDPLDPVWSLESQNTQRKLAEQQLCRVMSSSNRESDRKATLLPGCIFAFLAAVTLAIGIVLLVEGCRRRFRRDGSRAALIIFGVLLIVISSLFIVAAVRTFAIFSSVRKERLKAREEQQA